MERLVKAEICDDKVWAFKNDNDGIMMTKRCIKVEENGNMK